MENQEKTPLNTKTKNNKIVLNNRENLTVTGIARVYSANENLISLEVNAKNLLVEGSVMQVTKLDVEAGVMEVNGFVNSIKFANEKKLTKNLFSKIFK